MHGATWEPEESKKIAAKLKSKKIAVNLLIKLKVIAAHLELKKLGIASGRLEAEQYGKVFLF